MAPSPLTLAEFPPGLEKNSGMYSPTRSRSLASNTTSAQDTLDTTDFSENETGGNRAGDGDYGFAVSGERQHFDRLLAGLDQRLSSPEKPRSVVDYSQSPSPRRKGIRNRKSGCGALSACATPQELSQSPLPPHIKAALDAASAAMDSPKKIRPPPGLEDLTPEVPPQMCAPPGFDLVAPGLQEPPRGSQTRYQTPPPSERRPTSIMTSPCGRSPVVQATSPYLSTLDQHTSPYHSQPPAHIAALWSTSPEAGPYSPKKAVRKSPEATSPNIFSTTPGKAQSGTPVPQQPATWGSGLAPSMPAPPLTPPQPASWGGGLVPALPPQQAMWHAGPGSPVPPQPSSWGSPVPLQPATWGAGPGSPVPPQPATWGGVPGVPSCPPPAWPAPRSLEAQSPDTIWIDEDAIEAPPGLSKKPYKVHKQRFECEVLALDPCQPAKKHVPEWF